MARIELRHCDIILRDGLAGTALINEMSAMSGDADLTIDTVALNTDDTDLVPVGARFTVQGETASDTVHTVTARTANPTTNIVFTPPLSAGTYTNNNVITFQPQQLTIKIGDGDLRYTERDEFNYDLDRGELDTVRQGNDVPMEVVSNFVYEQITTGTSEDIAPMDAIKRRGGASEWVSAAADLCEPYAVDLLVVHTPPCGTAEAEFTLFPDLRSEQREVNFKESNIQITGRCNRVEPVTWRGDISDEPVEA
jgi:hypothetical protein